MSVQEQKGKCLCIGSLNFIVQAWVWNPFLPVSFALVSANLQGRESDCTWTKLVAACTKLVITAEAGLKWGWEDFRCVHEVSDTDYILQGHLLAENYESLRLCVNQFSLITQAKQSLALGTSLHNLRPRKIVHLSRLGQRSVSVQF